MLNLDLYRQVVLSQMSNVSNQGDGVRTRCFVSVDSMPSLPAHVRLHHDKVRSRWVLLAPERLLDPDEPALDTLKLCDGSTTVKEISNKLSEAYNAPAKQILDDIIPMLQDLMDKGFLQI